MGKARPGKWRRCTCGKHQFATEAEAFASALRASHRSGLKIFTYQCGGTRTWHIASRRAHPTNLTLVRRIAHYLCRFKTIERSWLYQQLDIPSGPSARREKVRVALAALESAGMLTRTETRIDAVDVHALDRVVRVGLGTYIREAQSLITAKAGQ